MQVVSVIELFFLIEGSCFSEGGLFLGVGVDGRLVVMELRTVGADEAKERVGVVPEAVLESEEGQRVDLLGEFPILLEKQLLHFRS